MNNDLLDKIHIRDLHARCILGIFPEEREKPQDIIVNLTIHADLRKPGSTDDIQDTIDYKKIKNAILSLVENSRFFLVEKLAQQIANVCLDTPSVKGVCVTVDKPGALRFARSVAIEITRFKSDALHAIE